MSATSGSDYAVELAFGLVFGLILSWSVGLAPALLYRYVIFRRAIEKEQVFWRLAPFVAVLAIAFKLTIADLTGRQPSGNPLPWIIIYYIGKWIMTRKPSEESLNNTEKVESGSSQNLTRDGSGIKQITSTRDYRIERKMFGLSVVVVYDCPSCGEELETLQDEVGQTDTCPACGGEFVVPGPDPVAESVEEPNKSFQSHQQGALRPPSHDSCGEGEKWSFKNGEKEFGPYDIEGLRDAAEKRWMGVNTLIRQEPDGEWISALTTGLIPTSLLRRNTPGNPWSARNLLIAGLGAFLLTFAGVATRDLTRSFLRDGHSPPAGKQSSLPSVSEGRDGTSPSASAPVAAQEPRNPFQEFTGASAEARSHYLRGLAAAQNREDFESAVQQFTEAIRTDSDYAEAYVARGCARLHNFNEHDLAIEDHSKAISLQPDYALAYLHRADTYWDEGQNHEALNDCNKAISLAPRFAQAFWLRGQVLMKFEEHERARADLERAEQLGFGDDGRWYPWQDASWQPWQEVTVPGVCKFTIPPTMEIQGGSFADLAGELRHGMIGPDDSIKRVVIQPRGLNAFKGKAFDTYARVIVEVSRNSEGSGLRQEHLRALTPADLREADEIFKQELIQQLQSAKVLGKETRLLEWKPCRIVRLGNVNALRQGYRRQLGDNPPVQVEGYLVPIDDLQCQITVSFRESERSKWATDLEKVVSSFEFEHR